MCKPRCRRTGVASLLVAVVVAVGIAGCSSLRRASLGLRQVQQGSYPVSYAVVPPTIDGKLDDDIWKHATPWKSFYEYKKRAQQVDIATAYLAWDRDNLYFAMEVKDEDLYATEKENDRILCLADVAELFVKPREDRLDLYEFEFNVWSALWYIHYIARGGGTDSRFTEVFHPGIVVKATHEGTINDWNDVDVGWAVEAAIPFKIFARAVPEGPQLGDTWKFNISGYDFSSYRERILVFTSCDGSFIGFDEYELYPELVFTAP